MPNSRFDTTYDGIISRTRPSDVYILQLEDGQELKATRSSLEGSEAFWGMLQGCSDGEGSSNIMSAGSDQVIKLHGDDPDAWRELLPRLHAQVTPIPGPLTPEVIIQILPVVHKYNFAGIMERCMVALKGPQDEVFSMSEASPRFVLKLLAAFDRLQLSDLLGLCTAFIRKHTTCSGSAYAAPCPSCQASKPPDSINGFAFGRPPGQTSTPRVCTLCNRELKLTGHPLPPFNAACTCSGCKAHKCVLASLGRDEGKWISQISAPTLAGILTAVAAGRQ